MSLLRQLPRMLLGDRLFERLCERLRTWVDRLPKPPRPYTGDYSYQNVHLRNVPDKGIILDVAAGHNPFPRATLLSDRWLETTTHRQEELVRDHRPFVLLDIHALPFADKSIDYIYCSHVLEHVDDPTKACAELMRVGKAGFIETPTFMKDALFAWANEMTHRWHVVRTGNRLVFFEYDRRGSEGVRSDHWRRTVLGPWHNPMQDLFYNNQDVFNTMLEWNDRFDVTVFRNEQSA